MVRTIALVGRLTVRFLTMGQQMAVFDLDGFRVETVRSESGDDAIEFTVNSDSSITWRFAILWHAGEPWEAARLAIDPHNSDVPLRAIEWAIGYSRENW